MIQAENNRLLCQLETILRPDPTRVALRPFTPAENGAGGTGLLRPRVQRIVDRVLSMDRADLEQERDRVLGGLSDKHGSLEDLLLRRFNELAEGAAVGRNATPDHKLVIGAYFVEEYSFESSALFNPSVVRHPDQSGLAEGAVRLVFSLRGVGEGHLSSISFRTGFSATIMACASTQPRIGPFRRSSSRWTATSQATRGRASTSESTKTSRSW